MAKHHNFSRSVLLISACTAVAGTTLHAAETLYQEGFNTDGTATGRYTMTGRDVYEVPRIQSELANFDQKGPLYWDHNFNVSYVGIPNIPARRAMLAWRTDPNGGAASDDLLKLWESTVDWLLAGKKNATIVVTPDAASIHELGDRLTAAGYTVVDDDATKYPDEGDEPGDLFIHGPGAGNASRFAMLPKPVIVMNEADYDDMIVGSIGSAVTFDPGNVTIAAPTHPAAGGKTGSFIGFNSPAQSFGLTGSFLAPGSTVLATVTRVVSPTIANLGDVDASIAGTKQHDQSTATATDIDFSDGSTGNWSTDNAIPGGYAGNWGLRATGKLQVASAGTYRIALGSDDGARLQIDLDKNGFSASDIILEDAGPHGHQIVYADVAFPAAGAYDFEVRSYNSGSGGSLEVSVSIDKGQVPDDALDSGYWELLSMSGTNVKLEAPASITSYIATGSDIEVQAPLIVLLNGPNDTPKGSFYDGGAFTGFEGTGFIGAAGLNKWGAYPDGLTYRALRLAPVSVAGKTNVKVTLALAAAQVDFEDSDFLDVVIYPNGANSTPVTLAHFRGVASSIQPWLADQKENFVRRLTKQFADFTYDVPPGATDLIVEIRAATTWWTEIVAFDNIRVTAGAASTGGGSGATVSVARDGADVLVTFTGNLERTANLGGAWESVATTGSPYRVPAAQLGNRAFFRARQ